MHRFIAFIVAVLASGSLAGSTGASAGDDPAGPDQLGAGSQLLYTSCKEHLGRFGLPPAALGDELPAGLSYEPSPLGEGNVAVNVVGLDCHLGDERVIDVFIGAPVTITNAPPGFTQPGVRQSVRVVRRYTTHPRAATRFAQWCFTDAIRQSDAQASMAPTAGGRVGDVSASDGVESISLHTTTTDSFRDEAAVSVAAGTAIQHFTAEAGQVRGQVVFEAGPGTRYARVGLDGRPVLGTGQLTLNGVSYVGFGAHVISDPLKAPFDFLYAGVTACPPGLD